MQWTLDVGPHYETLKKVEEQTGKTPGMLLDRPELYEDVFWVWQAYSILDKGRQWGFNGPQPILVSEIEAHIRLYNIDDRSDLVRYIQLMDGAYLSHHRKKLESEQKRNGRT